MRKEKVMKKRMIAWLLCACMTFTAAPEMLLADVAAKGQQTQEDEKSAGTGQTETETDRLEEEDQNSEKLTEEQHDHDQRRGGDAGRRDRGENQRSEDQLYSERRISYEFT